MLADVLALAADVLADDDEAHAGEAYAAAVALPLADVLYSEALSFESLAEAALLAAEDALALAEVAEDAALVAELLAAVADLLALAALVFADDA